MSIINSQFLKLAHPDTKILSGYPDNFFPKKRKVTLDAYFGFAIFDEITAFISLEDDRVANTLANASKVEASGDISKQYILLQYAVMHATLFLSSEIPFCKSLWVSREHAMVLE